MPCQRLYTTRPRGKVIQSHRQPRKIGPALESVGYRGTSCVWRAVDAAEVAVTKIESCRYTRVVVRFQIVVVFALTGASVIA